MKKATLTEQEAILTSTLHGKSFGAKTSKIGGGAAGKDNMNNSNEKMKTTMAL